MVCSSDRVAAALLAHHVVSQVQQYKGQPHYGYQTFPYILLVQIKVER